MRQWILLAFASIAPLSAASLANDYSYRVWHSQDGLPQDRIRVISQTTDGYLWIGTVGGLARFDGARFYQFDRSNTPAIRDDGILALYPSRDGSLWIGTEGGGLLRYSAGAFQVTDAHDGLTNGFVRSLCEDSAGTLWIGTDRGFFRMKRGGQVERLDNRDGIGVVAVTGIRQDQAGRIWVSTGTEMLVVDDGVVHQYLPGNPALSGLLGLHVRREGGVWVQTLTGLRLLENDVVRGGLTKTTIQAVSLCEDSDGTLWIGTLGDGLSRMDSKGLASYRSPDVLPSNTVWSVFEDRERNIWVGTHDGLVRLARKTVMTLGAPEGVLDENVMTTFAGPSGTLWLTTITGNIYRYANGKVSLFQLPGIYRGAAAKTAFEDSHGVIWIGTNSDGAVRIAGNQITSLTKKDGLRSNQVRQFLEDRHGGIWLALASGMSRWDGRQLHSYYIEDGLPYGSVRVLMEDHAGDILVGTDGGLGRIHNGKFVADKGFGQLDGERIWALHEDSDHMLWVGTRGGGLIRLRDDKVARITVREGLPTNAVFQILEDDDNNLWIGGPAGVVSASRTELNRIADGNPGPIALLQHGTADGMPSAHINGAFGWAGTRAPSGEMWFPTVKGAVRIEPKQVRTLPPPSQVLIESITADEKPVPLTGDIRIPPGHGKLEIDYSAPSLLTPERISFKYKLENFDEDWILASSRRSAYYTNLPPGHYKFRVVATDGVAPGRTSEASVSFVGDPHFYQTYWFYALCLALAAGCVWLAMVAQVRQTRARYALLLAERTRLAREMHDTVIQGCVAVSTLLEAASGSQPVNAGRARELTDQARTQVRLTLDEARQAVWDLRNTPLEGDICGALPDFARQISLEKGIPIDVETTGSPTPLDQGAIRDLLLVAREAIRNAVTHGSPRQVRIRLCFEADEIRLEVNDDGHGFAPDGGSRQSSGHYGILGMRERVEQLGGVFELNSSPGHGTQVVARLPLRGPVTVHT